ncbi:hypothetical protein [Campylobacter cuniculorum]|uniref:hypothetical protein n=1 Tax=Campylobacter cuniculorum TaxID=374106 RepID=UPI003C6C2647
MSPSRKAINFDLSTNELKKHFKDTREPYIKIKKLLCSKMVLNTGNIQVITLWK